MPKGLVPAGPDCELKREVGGKGKKEGRYLNGCSCHRNKNHNIHLVFEFTKNVKNNLHLILQPLKKLEE